MMLALFDAPTVFNGYASSERALQEPSAEAVKQWPVGLLLEVWAIVLRIFGVQVELRTKGY